MTTPSQTLFFADLPKVAELALFEWLGESDNSHRRLQRASYTLRHVPVREMKSFAMGTDIGGSDSDFEFAHESHLSLRGSVVPDYLDGPRWPVIAAGLTDDPVDDGWRRLHEYVEAGDASIPLLVVDFGDWPDARRRGTAEDDDE